jgi:glycosyltransferase involved in cell wall biosynthesis
MKIVAIIPCYRVKLQVEAVLKSLPKDMPVICVDDACPEGSGKFIESLGLFNVTVIYNDLNKGVGGAVKAGYRHALEHTNADIFVKIDGDGQMPVDEIAELVKPIVLDQVDYAKGNRFYYLKHVRKMPLSRLLGNICLSFLTKLSSGYWDVMDPTNGFTAISRGILSEMDLDEIDDRYYFESDMLCKLYLYNAQIGQLPMRAKYGDEKSSLVPHKMLFPFFFKNMRNIARRIFFSYFVRDFDAGSLALIMHVLLGLIGLIYGGINWVDAYHSGEPKASGVVMLAALCVILSVQSLVFFLHVDMQNNPNIKRRHR